MKQVEKSLQVGLNQNLTTSQDKLKIISSKQSIMILCQFKRISKSLLHQRGYYWMSQSLVYDAFKQSSKLENQIPTNYPFFRKQNYDVIFLEDSNGEGKHEVNLKEKEKIFDKNSRVIYALEDHLDQVLKLIKNDIKLSHKSQEDDPLSYESLKSKTVKKQEERVSILSASEEQITRNCTSKIVDKIIELLELFPQLGLQFVPSYKRKIQQILYLSFYQDQSHLITLRQVRKILFLSINSSFPLITHLCLTYFSFHSSNQKEKNEKKGDTLKFDNEVDLIIYLNILKLFPLTISSQLIKEQSKKWLEGLAIALETKKHEMRLNSFMMLLNSLCSVCSEEESEKANLGIALKRICGVAVRQFSKLQVVEQKIEMMILLAIVGEKEATTFMLNNITKQVGQQLDMINFNQRQLQLICYNFSLLNANHKDCFEYLQSILIEQQELSSQCFTNLLNYRNKIQNDLQYSLKMHILSLLKQDHKLVLPIETYNPKWIKDNNENDKRDLIPAHPSLRYKIGFQAKLGMFLRLQGSVHIEEQSFVDLLADLEQFDWHVLEEELSLNGINQALFTCCRICLMESSLFNKLEEYMISILEQEKINNKQLWQIVGILNSYFQSQFKPSTRFLNAALIFLLGNIKRFDVESHNILFSLLNNFILRTHLNDFGTNFTITNNLISPLEIILMQIFTIAEPIQAIKTMKVSSVVFKQLVATIKIAAPQLLESVPKLLEVNDSKNIPHEVQFEGTTNFIFLQEINKILESLNVEFTTEQVIFVYQADFYLPKHKLFLQVNKQSSYIYNTNQMQTQKLRMKKIHLDAIGIRTYDIPSIEFHQTRISDRPEYLESLKNKIVGEIEKYE